MSTPTAPARMRPPGGRTGRRGRIIARRPLLGVVARRTAGREADPDPWPGAEGARREERGDRVRCLSGRRLLDSWVGSTLGPRPATSPASARPWSAVLRYPTAGGALADRPRPWTARGSRGVLRRRAADGRPGRGDRAICPVRQRRAGLVVLRTAPARRGGLRRRRRAAGTRAATRPRGSGVLRVGGRDDAPPAGRRRGPRGGRDGLPADGPWRSPAARAPPPPRA